jgi:hypothetical protein
VLYSHSLTIKKKKHKDFAAMIDTHHFYAFHLFVFVMRARHSTDDEVHPIDLSARGNLLAVCMGGPLAMCASFGSPRACSY